MTQHHILAPFHLIGGGVWHAIDFAKALEKSGLGQTRLWSPRPAASALSAYPIDTIEPYSGACPDGGHLWVIGPDVDIGHWYGSCKFEQVTLVYNQHAPDLFYRCMHALTAGLEHEVSIQYASSALAREIGLPGEIHPPAFDIGRFFEEHAPMAKSPNRPFTVGRSSRDVTYKHHVDDPLLYRALLEAGCKIELVGASCIASKLPASPHLNISGEVHQRAIPAFLDRLDCFLYRTSPRKPEGFGLCIVEAMAAGLTVVAARQGGYADIIRSGENGFLFESNEEAVKSVLALKQNPDMRKQIGASAKQTIRRLFNNQKRSTSSG
ncbi:MAG TPA: glycosyltransferase family 4 protein [Methylophilaceae bacterium]|nr:glycosyltransferase family 4 protein [Methylophilaceae bacterium]